MDGKEDGGGGGGGASRRPLEDSTNGRGGRGGDLHMTAISILVSTLCSQCPQIIQGIVMSISFHHKTQQNSTTYAMVLKNV